MARLTFEDTLFAVVLFLAVTTIVILTNAKYKDKEAAESTQH